MTTEPLEKTKPSSQSDGHPSALPTPRLRVVEFQLMQRCNLNCIYCGYDQGVALTPDNLPLSLLARTLEELAPHPPEWVWFEGGEVTMNAASRALLLEALKLARRAGVKSRINTNAQACPPELSRELAAAGLSFACVSCDSANPEQFCRMRGQDPSRAGELFETFTQNVQGLVEAGITVDLEVTLTNRNLDQLRGVYDLAQSFGSNLLMGVQFLVPTSDRIEQLYPDFQSQQRAIEELLEHAQGGLIPVRICCCPLVPCRYPQLYAGAEKVIWVGCSCGHDYVHIHANGDVFLCGFWDHSVPIGNLHQASLAAIWHHSSLRQRASRVAPPGCGGCSHWDGDELRCHNTCFAIVYRKEKRFDRESYGLVEELFGRPGDPQLVP